MNDEIELTHYRHPPVDPSESEDRELYWIDSDGCLLPAGTVGTLRWCFRHNATALRQGGCGGTGECDEGTASIIRLVGDDD